MSDRERIRVFVGIKLDPEIARQLAELARPLERFPARLVPPADLHLTLVPPWNETEIAVAIDKLRRAVRDLGPLPLALERVCYGPNPRQPRMLWVECAADPELARAKQLLLDAFGQSERRPFLPHITLARIPKQGPLIARKHPLDRKLTLRQTARTIELFRSPPPGGAGYEVLASLPLTPGAGEPASN